MQRANRFIVAAIRGGDFPLYEIHDTELPTSDETRVVDYDADGEEMEELADAMNRLDREYNHPEPTTEELDESENAAVAAAMSWMRSGRGRGCGNA